LSSRIHTLIAGHGSFSQGLLAAAEKIVGKQEGVACISNDSMGLADIVEKIKRVLTKANNRVYVFIDLLGGSCFTACSALTSENHSAVFIAGVNLPMLVTYLSYRERLSGEDLLRKTLEAGQRGIERICM